MSFYAGRQPLHLEYRQRELHAQILSHADRMLMPGSAPKIPPAPAEGLSDRRVRLD